MLHEFARETKSERRNPQKRDRYARGEGTEKRNEENRKKREHMAQQRLHICVRVPVYVVLSCYRSEIVVLIVAISHLTT